MKKPVRIFLSAGEASGDLYGARLIEALRERLGAVECLGCGGDRMRAAGCDTLVDARQMAMVGIVEVIPGLARAWRALRTLGRSLEANPPDLAVLIDFPDFNLRLARRCKALGIPVLYFVAPQIWAWRRGRLRTLRSSVDRLACIFPFEQAFFSRADVPTQFVGHPLVDWVAPRMSAEEFRARLAGEGLPPERPLIALLPGSREKEILLNLPPMLESARLLASTLPCGFVLPVASTISAEWLRGHARLEDLPVHVVENSTYDAIAHAQAAIVASGTAAVETALLGTPLVIVYRVSRATWMLGRWLVHTPYYSMVNLVAGREVVPEFIQSRFQPQAVAGAVRQLLEYPAVRARMCVELETVAERLRFPTGAGPISGPPPGIKRGQADDPIQRVAALAESMLEVKAPSQSAKRLATAGLQ